MATADDPLPARGLLTVVCSRCGSVTRVGLLEFLVLQFPVGAWLPRSDLRPLDDLPGVSTPHLDQRLADPVTAALLAAAASTSSPGGIAGHLLNFHGPAAYALIGFLAFAEAALMVGFFIPGETAVVIGGVLAGLGRVNLGVMIVVVVVCAIVGDSVGFEVGSKAGPWLTTHRPLKGNSAVRSTLGLLESYGGPAVFLGRFIAFARAFIPGLAGMSGLRYRTFLFWNVLGGICWGVGYTMLGYVVGVSFQRILTQIGLWSLAVVGVVVVGVVVFEVRRRRREKRRIEAELEALDDEDGSPSTDGPIGHVRRHPLRRPNPTRTTTTAGRSGDPMPDRSAPDRRPGRVRPEDRRISRSAGGWAWSRWPGGCRTRRGSTPCRGSCRDVGDPVLPHDRVGGRVDDHHPVPVVVVHHDEPVREPLRQRRLLQHAVAGGDVVDPGDRARPGELEHLALGRRVVVGHQVEVRARAAGGPRGS